MGCIYPYDSLTTFQSELKTELIINRKEILSMYNEPLNSVILTENSNDVNLYSSQINSNSNFPFDSNIRNSLVPRLSLQKMNELFDDKDIECYKNKPKNLKTFSCSKNTNNDLSKINSIEKSLNSTLENTTKKVKKIITNKREIKKIRK